VAVSEQIVKSPTNKITIENWSSFHDYNKPFLLEVIRYLIYLCVIILFVKNRKCMDLLKKLIKNSLYDQVRRCPLTGYGCYLPRQSL
jgi:hypothetical protein